MIANGATTLWELWQKREGPSMNSHNHPMFGSVGSWLYKALAGINLAPGTTGFEKILIAPQMVRDLTHASGSTMTVRGEVACAWSRTERTVRVEVDGPRRRRRPRSSSPSSGSATSRSARAARPIWAADNYVAGAAGVVGAVDKDGAIRIKTGGGRYVFVLEGD